MVGQRPLKPLIVVRIHVSQQRNLKESNDYKISASRAYARDSVFMNKFYVYILECSDKSLYVGCTNNLDRRFKQHNDSKSGAHYTKIRRPVILKYSETFTTLKESRKREAEIKGWRREKKLKLFSLFDIINL